MKYLVLTNDHQEQEKIGRKIVADKANIYTESVIDFIRENAINNSKYRDDILDSESEIYRSIYHYWMYGCTADEYFFYEFYKKDSDEIKEYITSHEKVLYIEHLNDKKDAHYFDNKYDTYKVFKDYFKRDLILCETENDMQKFLNFVDMHPVFVVKPTDMGLGHGVHKASVEGFTLEQKKNAFYELLEEGKKNRQNFVFGKESSVVLEELIDQDEEMSRIHPDSVNGIRIATVKVGNEVCAYKAWFKIGRGGQFVTSAAYGTFDAGIDVETGIVTTPGFNETGDTFDIHPDTNVPIVGFQIPKWNEAIALVKEMAQKLPNVHYTGWDVVLSKNGWCIMEGNFKGNFMWQLCENKGCKKEFEELIGWKLEKEFWWE